MTETRKVSEIVYRDDLYPRINADVATIQRYADNLDVMPPIEVNQHNELIDGYHRWTAHRKLELDEIIVEVTQTKSDADLFELAILRNNTHGLQMNNKDKQKAAQRLYLASENKTPERKKELQALLSVSARSIASWLSDIDKADREERNETIKNMWYACYTDEEIADAVGMSEASVRLKTQDTAEIANLQKMRNLSSQYLDADWEPQLYDIWSFGKKTNKVGHFGNTEERIVDNLLYLFTDPFDIVIDPFAGGGSTIDVCKRRARRYWVADRKPIVERDGEIRKHDLNDGVTGPYHWGDVKLVYLDPPYWKQAAGKYSDDESDLANMSLEKFTETLTGIIDQYGEKMKSGTHIACIISPTQWPNKDKSTNYHDLDLIANVGKHLKLDRHIIAPYSTEQYNGTQVNIAKDKKLNMVISRRLVVWEVI